MPGQFSTWDPIENAPDQAIAEGDEVRCVSGQVALGDPLCFGESDDARDVFGPGPAVALVPASPQLRLQPHAGAHHQAADTLRTMELVRRHGQDVDAPLSDAHRDLAGRLDRISVEVGVAV